jgi:hypothetical protein
MVLTAVLGCGGEGRVEGVVLGRFSMEEERGASVKEE